VPTLPGRADGAASRHAYQLPAGSRLCYRSLDTGSCP
jgi:hypothetical protein